MEEKPTTSMKPVLLSFSSNGRESYNSHLLKMLDTAIEHWKGDYLIYSPDHELREYRGIKIKKGLPEPKNFPSLPHSEMPYQFKVALIQQARDMGYTKIVWLDTSMKLVKDIEPLFCKETGITVFHNLGHELWKYISDDACRKLGVEDFRLLIMDQTWGGALFFDFSVKNAVERFELLKKHSLDGSFQDGTSIDPRFKAHRHDQAVMSVLFHKHSTMLPYGSIVCSPHDKPPYEYGKDYYIVCR